MKMGFNMGVCNRHCEGIRLYTVTIVAFVPEAIQ